MLSHKSDRLWFDSYSTLSILSRPEYFFKNDITRDLSIEVNSQLSSESTSNVSKAFLSCSMKK